MPWLFLLPKVSECWDGESINGRGLHVSRGMPWIFFAPKGDLIEHLYGGNINRRGLHLSGQALGFLVSIFCALLCQVFMARTFLSDVKGVFSKVDYILVAISSASMGYGALIEAERSQNNHDNIGHTHSSANSPLLG